ncbi:HMA2 domain-containing protein [Desulfovibrio legallii]|uniref:Cation transporter n=1 Tax=Desulfovibrio legallii TaxID=571438 RepID=A0A1G7LTR0_9BACT|nr:hypothetical protein [Desulfovibrio legallii]SDF52833.1 hypothetical protein SAMN05192586_10726 [Desulfovibrio legallii]
MSAPLHLLKYVRSFMDGRVRIRHPALQHEHVAGIAKSGMEAVPGVHAVECNPLSGSLLIHYDSAALPRERLFALGEAWALYLDAVLAGKPATPPQG